MWHVKIGWRSNCVSRGLHQSASQSVPDLSCDISDDSCRIPQIRGQARANQRDRWSRPLWWTQRCITNGNNSREPKTVFNPGQTQQSGWQSESTYSDVSSPVLLTPVMCRARLVRLCCKATIICSKTGHSHYESLLRQESSFVFIKKPIYKSAHNLKSITSCVWTLFLRYTSYLRLDDAIARASSVFRTLVQIVGSRVQFRCTTSS